MRKWTDADEVDLMRLTKTEMLHEGLYALVVTIVLMGIVLGAFALAGLAVWFLGPAS